VTLHNPEIESDQTLVRQFLRGDERAFRAIHSRHSPHLRALIRRILGRDHSELDDVVQDTWLSACRGMSTFRGNSTLFSWLAAIGVRAAYRRATRRDDSDELRDDDHAAPVHDPTSSLDVERALNRLSARERAVVILHDVEGFTHDEIATHLGIATGTSRNTLVQARAGLRRQLRVGEAYV
jgi:RNA polymerase sigma-70 factor (ECF subfamily)